ncbi:MAG: SH3 domain-containing protein [Anaerolineales bacterium]|nr:SH3 domain-containing protein [Anaerolineales bacterium]
MTLKQLFNKWVILGALAFAGLLLLITALSIGFTSPLQPADVGFAPANLTVIPASTATSSAPPTATIDPFAPTPVPTGIAIGNYVQITGTDGEGLRIRSEPGLDGNPDFLGFDSEVFIVREGPVALDGYVWWYLVAPYDETRAGWAAADFLSYIPSP